MSKRLSRFLIDKVDKCLNDIEKEKKFDILMIVVGITVFIIGLSIVVFPHVHKGLFFLGLFFLLSGFVLIYVMTKEYISDCKKDNQERH